MGCAGGISKGVSKGQKIIVPRFPLPALSLYNPPDGLHHSSESEEVVGQVSFNLPAADSWQEAEVAWTQSPNALWDRSPHTILPHWGNPTLPGPVYLAGATKIL